MAYMTYECLIHNFRILNLKHEKSVLLVTTCKGSIYIWNDFLFWNLPKENLCNSLTIQPQNYKFRFLKKYYQVSPYSEFLPCYVKNFLCVNSKWWCVQIQPENASGLAKKRLETYTQWHQEDARDAICVLVKITFYWHMEIILNRYANVSSNKTTANIHGSNSGVLSPL